MQQHGAQGAAAQAVIRYGVYNQPGAFVGKSIGDVRRSLAPQWGIPDDARPYKGKEQLNDDYIIQAGDNIEIHRQMGEKG